jgi:hypothetical protein
MMVRYGAPETNGVRIENTPAPNAPYWRGTAKMVEYKNSRNLEFCSLLQFPNAQI